MSESASLFHDSISRVESEDAIPDSIAADVQAQMATSTPRATRKTRRTKKSPDGMPIDEAAENKSSDGMLAEAAAEERALLESLKKVRDRSLAARRRAVAQAFEFADQCSAFAQRLPKSEVLAFIEQECRVPRTEAQSYLKLTEVLGPEREMLRESAVEIPLLFQLLKQPEPVRAEALNMLRSGRTLSRASLRALRQDVLAREERGKPDRSPIKELQRAVRVRARNYIERLLQDLAGLANAYAALYNETVPEDRSPETVARVDTLAADARRLADRLAAVAPADLFTARANFGRSWGDVYSTLRFIADRKLCLEEDWSWPETHPLWMEEIFHKDLVWALGQEVPELEGRRRPTPKGVAPLDCQPRSAASRPTSAFEYTVLELCAGAGGQAIGLHAAGFRHVGIVEINPEAVETLRTNRRSWPIIKADLNTLDVSQFKGVDLIAGGLPCQPYSQAGERRGAEDERDLFDRTLQIIETVRPRAVMIENVVGIMHVTHGLRRLSFLSALESLGYEAEWRVIDGPSFGLGQNRRRAILVAMQSGLMHRFRWPLPPEMAPMPVGTLLRDLMGARGWKGLDKWVAKANRVAPTLIGGSAKKMGMDLAQPKSRESWHDLGVDPGRVVYDAPDPDFVGRPSLTLPMLARLQDFPDNWVFAGSRLSQFRQIANAFPPRLSRVTGLALLRALSGEEIDLRIALQTPLFKRIDLAELRAHELARELAEEAEWI